MDFKLCGAFFAIGGRISGAVTISDSLASTARWRTALLKRDHRRVTSRLDVWGLFRGDADFRLSLAVLPRNIDELATIA